MQVRPIITNVIGSGQLQISIKLDLQYIASKVQGSRLNFKKFPGLVIRKTKPKGTILLFRSNKFLIVGTDNQQNSQTLSRRLSRDLQKILNISKIKIKTFRISNMIANGNLGYQINLTRIAQLPNAYKDDKSRGVYMKLSKVKCIVIFQSGKVLLNGTTKRKDIQQIFDNLVIDLQKFKLTNIKDKKDKDLNQDKIITKRVRKPKNKQKNSEQANKNQHIPPSSKQSSQYQQKSHQQVVYQKDEHDTAYHTNSKQQQLINHSQNDDKKFQQLPDVLQDSINQN